MQGAGGKRRKNPGRSPLPTLVRGMFSAYSEYIMYDVYRIYSGAIRISRNTGSCRNEEGGGCIAHPDGILLHNLRVCAHPCTVVRLMNQQKYTAVQM